MRSLLIGLFSGFLLSSLRAPVGVELLQIPAASAGAAMAYRAAALLVIGVGLILGLRSAHERFSSSTVLIGVCVGFQMQWQQSTAPGAFTTQVVLSLLLVTLLIAGHQGGEEARPNKGRIVLLVLAGLGGWYLVDQASPEGHGAAILVALLGLFSLAVIGRLTGRAQTSEQLSDRPAPPRGGLTSIAICGAGVAMLVEGLCRHLRLLGGGLAADDSVFGSVFLGLALIGALAFGRAMAKSRRAHLLRSVVAAMAGLAALGTFRVLSNFATNRGLDLYLRNSLLELDLSAHGMFQYDLLIAAPVLVLPAFLCGTLIALHHRPVELAALLIGAAGGLVVAPQLLEFQWSSDTSVADANFDSTALAMLGGLIAAASTLLAVFSRTDWNRRDRLIGALAAFAGIALCRFPAIETIQVLSPWEKRDAQPEVVRDTPTGLICVERDEFGDLVASLDRQPLNKTGPARAGDLEHIRLSWSMMGSEVSDAETRVLFVGQLDVSRALHLVDLGATTIDRTGAWFDAMPMIEHYLFDGTPGWFPGEILSPSSARSRLDQGQYDLVIVAAVPGKPPTTRNLASPPDTTVVVWLDGASGIETQHLGAQVLVSAPSLSSLYVGIARGPHVEALREKGGRGAPTFLGVDDPLDPIPVMQTLSTRERNRPDLHRARLADRMAAMEISPGLGAGLATHFHAQAPSSPFETEEQKIELDPLACELFRGAALAPEPNSLAIEVIENLAHILTAQRKIEEIDEFLARPAERHRPWLALELALALASMEFLEPEAALQNLAVAHGVFGGSPVSLAMQAEAQSQTGDDVGAVRSLELALKLQPGHTELERRLAIALRRAGDARGTEAVEHALEHAPEDPELINHKGEGPYPPAPAGYHPIGPVGDGHGH